MNPHRLRDVVILGLCHGQKAAARDNAHAALRYELLRCPDKVGDELVGVLVSRHELNEKRALCNLLNDGEGPCPVVETITWRSVEIDFGGEKAQRRAIVEPSHSCCCQDDALRCLLIWTGKDEY